MDVRVSPSHIQGTVHAPPSKSYTHRAIFAAAHARGGRVDNPLLSADTKASIRAVEEFGGTVTISEGQILVEAPADWPHTPEDVINCANSGTTMRLAIATGGLINETVVLTGDESLRSRPQGPLLDAVAHLGGEYAESTRRNGRAPVVVSGTMDGGAVPLPGDIPSQYVTALLMIGPRMDGGVIINLDAPPREIPYINITLELLDAFGVRVQETEHKYSVSEMQQYQRPDTYSIPGDFSSISYPLAAGAVAGEIVVRNALPNPQGDSEIITILDRMGADIDWDREAGTVSVAQRSLRGIQVDVTDIPDLLPTIAVLGAAADGTTEITNCAHVRDKESDRVEIMANILSEMGAEVYETEGTMTVYGDETSLQGATVDGHNDHRVIMATSIAALIADGPTTICGAEHADVSYPMFFDHLSQVGVNLEMLE